jgi:hypothetical protein
VRVPFARPRAHRHTASPTREDIASRCARRAGLRRHRRKVVVDGEGGEHPYDQLLAASAHGLGGGLSP